MILEKQEFQKLLFRVAFCTIACDGKIDEMEINEMRIMDKSVAYFQGIDLSDELNDLVKLLKEHGKKIIDEMVNQIRTSNLSLIQALLILEVAFRLAYANKEEAENERKFIRFLRSSLNIPDQIIRDRFGVVDFLFDKDYSKDIVKTETQTDLLSSIKIPEMKELESVDFSNFKE